MKYAKHNYELKGDKEGPRDYVGFKQNMAQAQQHLAFIPGDRAPHGFVMLCLRWYLKMLALHLSQDEVLQPVESTWQQVRGKVAQDLESLGYMVGRGLLYTYGCGSPKRQPCDTSQECDDEPHKYKQ